MGILSHFPATDSMDACGRDEYDARRIGPDRPAPAAKPGVAPVLIIASASEIAPLTDGFGRSLLPASLALALNADEPVPPAALDGAEVLVIEVDLVWPGSLERLRAVRQHCPSLPVVAAIRGADVRLVGALIRQGIADVVSLPFDRDELERVTRDAITRRHSVAERQPRIAPLISVVGSIGGCGATTIATHLAAELGARAPGGGGGGGGGGDVLADLDVQFGTASDYLGLVPHRRLNDLLDAHARLDEELMLSVATAAGPHLSVIAAPEAIMPLESIDTDQLLRVIAMMRRQFGFAVVDLPTDWTNWTLSAAMESSAILIVVEQTLPSLRQARRRLELFRSVGIDEGAVAVVVNRVERRMFGGIGMDDVAQALGRPVLASIRPEQPQMALAQNQGRLLGMGRGKSGFVRDIARLGDLLCDGMMAGPARAAELTAGMAGSAR